MAASTSAGSSQAAAGPPIWAASRTLSVGTHLVAVDLQACSGHQPRIDLDAKRPDAVGRGERRGDPCLRTSFSEEIVAHDSVDVALEEAVEDRARPTFDDAALDFVRQLVARDLQPRGQALLDGVFEGDGLLPSGSACSPGPGGRRARTRDSKNPRSW